VIQAENLGRRYGEHWALRGASFCAEPGIFAGVLGRNGAGKTTLVRLLTGQLAPTEGRAAVMGLDASKRDPALRRAMGVMPDTNSLLDNLTGAQYLGFAGRIHGLDGELVSARVEELGDLLEMDFRAGRVISEYSFGMKKKTALAAALLHGPSILFLDEPFEGLDPLGAAMVHDLLVSLHGRGMTIFMTSHLPERAEQLCDRILIVEEGCIAVDAAREELLADGRPLIEHFLERAGRERAGALSWM